MICQPVNSVCVHILLASSHVLKSFPLYHIDCIFATLSVESNTQVIAQKKCADEHILFESVYESGLGQTHHYCGFWTLPILSGVSCVFVILLQVSSRKSRVCDSGIGSGSSVALSSRAAQQGPVPGARPSHTPSPSPGHPDQQPGPWRTRHLSPLTPHPRPRARPTSTPSLRVSQTPLAGPGRPSHRQATYSSGTAWKDVSMAADPVLSHKRAAAANGQKR